MAKPVSEEELQLKKRARRRLIGAIALVAAVAAVLPMVLDSEPKPTSKDINIQIPSPDAKGSFTPKAVVAPRVDKAVPAKSEGKAAEAKGDEAKAPEVKAPETKAPETKTTETKAADPKVAEAKAAAAKTADAGTPKAKAAEKPTPPVPDNPNDSVLMPRVVRDAATAKGPEKAPEKTTDKASTKVAEKAPEKTAAPKAGPGAFFIQVIALSEADKAKKVQQQMADAGVRAYTEVINTGTGSVTRVRAGPFATREEAETARSKLQGIGLEGKVAAF